MRASIRRREPSSQLQPPIASVTASTRRRVLEQTATFRTISLTTLVWSLFLKSQPSVDPIVVSDRDLGTGRVK
ncbi:hypothetical protein [Baaleninema simplex]|uniref:hypothetical protein n=1 Tax=Baaleninema simplex TaxID=2862350 RepID=UPI001C556194|nr:hypothetical protein [Baaleninema simplex]